MTMEAEVTLDAVKAADREEELSAGDEVLHYSDCMGMVEQMIDQDMPLQRVEVEVDVMVGLDEEQKDALKLWAWGWDQTKPRYRNRSCGASWPPLT